MTLRTVEDYRRCAEAGMTMAEAAEHLGRSRNCVRVMAHRHDLKFAGDKGEIRRRWEECAAAGMTATEAAAHRGRSVKSAYAMAQVHGIRFAPHHKPEPKPKPAARPNVLDILSPAEAEDYRFLTKRYRYTRDEALVAIKRADLVEA